MSVPRAYSARGPSALFYGRNSNGGRVTSKQSALARLIGVEVPDPLADALRQCRQHFMAAAGFSLLINILYLAPTAIRSVEAASPRRDAMSFDANNPAAIATINEPTVNAIAR